MKKTAYVGIDYHISKLTSAVMIEGEKDFHSTIHLENKTKMIANYLKKLSSSSSYFILCPLTLTLSPGGGEGINRVLSAYLSGVQGVGKPSAIFLCDGLLGSFSLKFVMKHQVQGIIFNASCSHGATTAM